MAPVTRLRSGLRSASTKASSTSSDSSAQKQPNLRASFKSSKIAKPGKSTTTTAATKNHQAALKTAAKTLAVAGIIKDEPASRAVNTQVTNVHLLKKNDDGTDGELVHPLPETTPAIKAEPSTKANATGSTSPAATTTTTANNVLDKAIAHILSQAPQLEPIISANLCTPFTEAGLRDILNPFQSLASGIISQQVSGAAARSIKAKFVALFNSDIDGMDDDDDGETKFPTPEQVLETDIATLRTAGLSQRKAEYVKALAEAFQSGEVDMKLLREGSNEEIIEKLTKIRGIGVWSAEMFLLFHLRRLDVFSTGDLGIQRGMAVLAGKNVKALKTGGKGKWKYMAEKEMLEMAEKFKPYRSIFMWYLWKISDTEVEAMSAASKAKAKPKTNGKAKTAGKKKQKKEEEDDDEGGTQDEE